jgi:hypothetical protein
MYEKNRLPLVIRQSGKSFVKKLLANYLATCHL